MNSRMALEGRVIVSLKRSILIFFIVDQASLGVLV
jgi:hypothetical protein